jgi:hypothetical protein
VPRVVLRLGKRKTSWESRDVDTIVATEFTERNGVIDTQPSVYALDAASRDALRPDVVRVVAEHSASFLNDPPKGSVNLDLAGLAETNQTAGRSKFEFANSHHHEVQLDSVAGLRDLVRRALAEIDGRLHAVTRNELLDYAAVRLAARDPEWQTAMEGRKEWLRLIGKRPSASE